MLEGNEAALALYRDLGFVEVGRLVGFTRAAAPQPPADPEPLVAEPARVADAVERDGASRLPWQIAPDSLARMGAPVEGFRLGEAYVALEPSAERRLRLHALVPGPRPGELARLLGALERRRAPAAWNAPALFPDRPYRARFEALGFERGAATQLHMIRSLGGSP